MVDYNDLEPWDLCLFCWGYMAEVETAIHWPYCSLLCACRASLDSLEDDI